MLIEIDQMRKIPKDGDKLKLSKLVKATPSSL